MACRAQDSSTTKADEDPLQWEGRAAQLETGSVVGIHFEVEVMYTGTMYTGTMISDLIRTVERAEQRAEQRRIDEELHAIFAMQIPLAQGDQAFMGAA
jgi:hypothetical protein